VRALKVLIMTMVLTSLLVAQKEALIVGVSDYQGTKSDLSGIEIDVNNMKALFEKWGFNVTVLFDKESMKIDEYLQKYHSLGKDDAFALYYSGHGSHKDDDNSDEKDGQDETIVLSDGLTNKHYIDDDIYSHLNKIRAKKLVIFDSCHSGTAFKAFGDKPKPKSISPQLVTGTIQTKSFRHRESNLSGGEYIVFSASQDSEESLATSRGSLFTNAFVREFSASSKNSLVTKVVDGATLHQCNRLKAFFPLEAMVTTKAGKSLGYSKKSQEILNGANAFIRETIKIAVDGKVKEAVAKADKELVSAKEALLEVVMRSGVTPSDIASAKKAVTKAEKSALSISPLPSLTVNSKPFFVICPDNVVVCDTFNVVSPLSDKLSAFARSTPLKLPLTSVTLTISLVPLLIAPNFA